jgi:uncharacterized protein YcbX
MSEGFVSELYVYPVKSFAASARLSCEATPQGLSADRRWMWVDANGLFLTQRKFPAMCLWEAVFSDDEIIFSNKLNAQTCNVSFSEMSTFRMNVRVWSDTFSTDVYTSPALVLLAESLFSEMAYLAYLPKEHNRTISHQQNTTDAYTSFADSFPFMLASESSLAEINKRFSDPVSMRHFRPNIVVSGFEPFAEDTWRRIRIGECEFLLDKLCSRCSMVNPDTAHWQKDVLTTLALTRTKGNKVMFGRHALLNGNQGALKVGQQVCVLD